jgi:hypothetical protein
MAKSPLLSRAAILDADDMEYEDMDVPEWGGTVRVRALTGTERDAFESSMYQQRGKNMVRNAANIRAKLVARSVVDDEGERIFSDQDVSALGKKSAAALDRIFEVAAKLSRINEDDVEEMGKPSEDDPSDGSTSS